MVDNTSALDEITFRDSIIIQEQVIFSAVHVQSAAFLTRGAMKIAQEYQAPLPESIETEYRAYVIAAIFSAVAAVEAAIREFYINTITSPAAVSSWGLGTGTAQALAAWWQSGGEKKPTKEKYKEALKIAGKQPMPVGGKSVSENMAFLTELRNLLTHYTPAWRIVTSHDADQTTLAALRQQEQLNVDLQKQRKLEGQLKGLFRPDVLTASRSFPLTYLSDDCARWAVTSSATFINTFCANMVIPSSLPLPSVDSPTT